MKAVRYLLSILLLSTPLPLAAQSDLLSVITDRLMTSPDYQSRFTELEDALSRSLRYANPHGTAAHQFQQAADAPLRFHAVVQASKIDAADYGDYRAGLSASLASYEKFYELGSDCQFTTPTLPDSIEQAIAQINEIATAVNLQLEGMLGNRSRATLQRYHDEVLGILQSQPYGGDLSRAQRRARERYFDALDSADGDTMLCATRQWSSLLEYDWLDRLRQLMRSHPRANASTIASHDTALGRIILGGSRDTTYLLEDLLFIADLDGNDVYGLNSGEPFSGIPQMLIDFAGHDRYESSATGGFASGLGAPSVLIDVSGDDHYHSRQLSQGAGILGVGLLFDGAGDDVYEADSLAQGFALYGVGLLLDGGGDDRYTISALGQALGLTSALAELVDLAGDDDYQAKGLIPTNYGTPGLTDAWAQGVGMGIREFASGGVGRLFDGAGEDSFDASSFAQGGGYYFGVGLFQNAGDADDRYLGARYNFGWTAHYGIGAFHEEGGDDHYQTRQIVAAGLSWDHGLTLFHDASGSDEYALGDFSAGASAIHSIAYFIDGQGADRYLNVIPGAADQRGPNLSLFIDLGIESNRFAPLPATSDCVLSDHIGLNLILPALNPDDPVPCLP